MEGSKLYAINQCLTYTLMSIYFRNDTVVVPMSPFTVVWLWVSCLIFLYLDIYVFIIGLLSELWVKTCKILKTGSGRWEALQK